MPPTTVETPSDDATITSPRPGRRRLAVGALAFNATVVPLAGILLWRTGMLAGGGASLIAALLLVAGLSVLLIGHARRGADGRVPSDDA